MRDRILQTCIGLCLLPILSMFLMGMTVEQQQLCINSCLYNSPGASSNQYNQCVQRNCVPKDGQAVKSQTHWQVKALEPDIPPYVDGRMASMINTYGGDVNFGYLCSRTGDSYLVLSGEPLFEMGLLNGQNHRASLDFGAKYKADRILFEPGEGYLTVPIQPTSQILKKMKAGLFVSVLLPGNTFEYRLRGSSDALNEALDYCSR